MSKKLLFLWPVILLVVTYAFVILSEGGAREWVARWKEKAEAQGGPGWVFLRIIITIVIITVVTVLIQKFSK